MDAGAQSMQTENMDDEKKLHVHDVTTVGTSSSMLCELYTTTLYSVNANANANANMDATEVPKQTEEHRSLSYSKDGLEG